mgnify:CR=1 FL=1
MIPAIINQEPKTLSEPSAKEEESPKRQAALRAVWDMMEFFIWHPTLDTALAIKQQNANLPDKLTAAIHNRYMDKNTKTVIKTQLDSWQDAKMIDAYEWDTFIKFNFLKIIDNRGRTYVFDEPYPVEIKILKRRYKFFDHYDPKWYNWDDYKLANPWAHYWKARFIVQ